MSSQAQPSPPQDSKKKGNIIPLLTRIKARNLYLLQGLPYNEIASATGLSYKQVTHLASRQGWPKERKRRLLLMEEAADARLAQTSSEVIEAIASESEEIALKALGNTRDALDRTDDMAAKDSQSYSAVVKNLASTAKLLRSAGDSPLSAPSVTLNAFFLRPDPKPPEPKPVTEASLEVTTTPIALTPPGGGGLPPA